MLYATCEVRSCVQGVTLQHLHAQAVPQPLPQVFLGAASTSLPVSEAEAAGSRLAAWSQHPTSDPRTALPEPQVAPVPFEKVRF